MFIKKNAFRVNDINIYYLPKFVFNEEFEPYLLDINVLVFFCI